ncbi:MAG: WYL domain-containing protein, partial [Lachnospiraceae bacterium]|nr:WYL domain-containing protein [Lachnospiraceae bacterium]
FDYYSPKAESTRILDPYYLIFKWSSWYVWGYCRTKQEFRMFKLNRMDGLELTDEQIPDREIPFPELETKTFFPANVHLKAVLDPSMKWQLIENYGPSSFLIQEDGSLLFEADEDEEGLIAWILSCGNKVTVLEPQSMRERLFAVTSELSKKYRD